MATINGYTKAKMDEINNKTVVDAHINGSGHLILDLRDTTTIDAGSVIGPEGPMGSDSPGDLKCSIRATAEAGWLKLDGSVINNADTLYPDLWAVVAASTPSWISGTTMTLPDMTETVAQGAGGSAGALGSIAHANSKGILAAELPPHSHTGPSHTHVGGAHTHGMTHTHTHAHTHEHPHTHSDSFAATATVESSVRKNSTPGDSNSFLTAVLSGATDIVIVNPAVDVVITGSVGNASEATTGGASTANTGASSAASTGSGGAVNTSAAGTGPTGMGPGTGALFDVQQRSLSVNWFIKT